MSPTRSPLSHPGGDGLGGNNVVIIIPEVSIGESLVEVSAALVSGELLSASLFDAGLDDLGVSDLLPLPGVAF